MSEREADVTDRELAERALDMSATCIESCVRELEGLGVRRDTVASASKLVRETRAEAGETARQVEHFAFTLLTTLFHRLPAQD